MFVCPIFFSQAMVPAKIKWIVQLNPLSSLFELFRYAFLGKGYFSFEQIFVFIGCNGTDTWQLSILMFNKTADKLMDVI